MVKRANLKLFVLMLGMFFLRRRSRVTVALLAVIIGATVFFGMLTIYYDVPARLSAEFRAYGANILLISEKGISKGEVEELKRFVPETNLVGITPYIYKTMLLNSHSVTVAYTDIEQAVKINPFWQVRGSAPSKSGEALIGSDLADILEMDIGFAAELEDIKARILFSGILKTGSAGDNFVYLDISELGEDYSADIAELSISLTGDALEEFAIELGYSYPDITPKLIKRVVNSETAVLGKLKALVLFVTIIVLTLTMICVSTTMTAVVLERLKEIGLKKAIGAHSKSILIEFFWEALILGFIGGLIGLIAGFGFANFVSISVFGVSVVFHLSIAAFSVFASIVFTVIAGMFPVYSAANVNPIEVLRGE
ncbi:MAG: FtsX-like permease family protein [Deferribacteraceae bacterium]|jgi:putative ABC transport system permease protein|nr:FtsX-like permease family protein [Deferribacteraceae bacterium]